MKKRILAILLCITLVATMLIGCGKDGESQTGKEQETKETEKDSEKEDTGNDEASESKDLHFEIVSKGFQSTYWQAVYKGASAKAEELGVTINMVGPNSESDIAD